MLAAGPSRAWPAALERPVRRRRADRARRLHRQPAPRPLHRRQLTRRTRAPDVRAYFAEADGTPGRCRRPAAQPGLCRIPAPPRRARAPTRSIAARPRSGSSRAPAPGPLAGTMTLADLAGYRPVKREPLCRPYRVYLLCVPPPPSSGVGAAPADGDARADRHRRARARRSAGLVPVRRGEPADVRRPRPLCRRSGLRRRCRSPACSIPAYVAARAAPDRRPRRRRRPPPARRPARPRAAARRDAASRPAPSHFVVGDAAGNVVSMTTTVESIFGSGRMVDGFFLNNQMTDFSFRPRDAQGRPVGQCGRAGQAAALVDDAGDPARRRPAASSARSARRAATRSSPMSARRWSARSTGGCRCRTAIALPNLDRPRRQLFNGEVDQIPAGGGRRPARARHRAAARARARIAGSTASCSATAASTAAPIRGAKASSWSTPSALGASRSVPIASASVAKPCSVSRRFSSPLICSARPGPS